MQSKTGFVMLGTCTLIGPICGLDPIGLALLLHVTGLGMLIAYRLDHRKWPMPNRTLTIALGVLLAWAAISCFWTRAESFALVKLPELIAIAASALIIPVAIRDMPKPDATRSQKTLQISLFLGVALCLVDISLGGPIKHLHKHWPTIPINAYDREIVCFSLFIWPAALIVFRKGLRCSSIILLCLGTVATLFSQSHSAMLGMILGLSAFAAAWVAPKLVRRGLSAVTVIGFTIAVPVGLKLTEWGLDQNPHLQFSFRHRIQIWHFTAERILHWPWFGLGLESSRAIPLEGLPADFLPLGGNTPPLHPHDFFLQIWLELGLIGVIAALYFMLRLFEATATLEKPARVFTLAACTATLAIASFAFGIWQGWWLACLVLLASLLLLAAKDIRDP